MNPHAVNLAVFNRRREQFVAAVRKGKNRSVSA